MQWDDIRLDRDGGIIVGDLLNGWPEDGEPNMNNDLTVYESALEIATLNAANKVLQARVAELEAKNGKLLTVLYSADAFMQCPTENYMDLSKLADTLREAIDIASNKHDPFDDLVESGGFPETQALGGDDE